jgi:hypothetical protein
MSSSSPTKKRKANDGRATASDDTNHDHLRINGGGGSGTLSSWLGYYFSGRRGKSAPPPASCNENLSQKMDRMEQIMLRMEEKCNRLEAKCNSLENSLKEHVDSKIGEAIDSLDAKIDQKFKQHAYNDMIQKNQSWEYSAPVHSVDYYLGLLDTLDDAEYVSEASEILREATEKMRRGEFPDDSIQELPQYRGFSLEIGSGYDDDVNNYLLPHWREFAAALKLFTPALDVLSEDNVSYFNMYHVELNNDAMLLLRDALLNKPFRSLSIVNNPDGETVVGGMSLDAIMDIMDSNKSLRSLDIENIHIGDCIHKICSSARNYPFLELSLNNCFRGVLGDEMLTSLLRWTSIPRWSHLKLEKLSLCHNGITSRGIRLLSDFLATNPPLKKLELEGNLMTNHDATLFANALRSNTSLRRLDLSDNRGITDEGGEAFRLVVNDDSTLNSVADSNHSCSVYLSVNNSWNLNLYDSGNELAKDLEKNRALKIYILLSSRNRSMSNVQHFGGMDIKMLPNMIEAVQRYAELASVKELSIVYEVMRKWEEVFPLYELIEHN